MASFLTTYFCQVNILLDKFYIWAIVNKVCSDLLYVLVQFVSYVTLPILHIFYLRSVQPCPLLLFHQEEQRISLRLHSFCRCYIGAIYFPYIQISNTPLAESMTAYSIVCHSSPRDCATKPNLAAASLVLENISNRMAQKGHEQFTVCLVFCHHHDPAKIYRYRLVTDGDSEALCAEVLR